MTTVAAIGVATCVQCAAAEGIAAPPGRFSWVIDGVSIDARESRTRDTVAHLGERFRTEWRAEHPQEPVAETHVGSSRVLGQRVGRTFRVVQLTAEPDGTTRVVQSSRALGLVRRSGAPEIPVPAGATVIRRLEMLDGSEPVVQVYAIAAEPPPLAETRFDAAARRAGWERAPATHRRFATAAHAWRRGGDELLVVTTPIETGTGFLLHLTTRPAAGRTP